MISQIRPYPAYKDSEIEWLGKVPEHWLTCRAKWLFCKIERPVRKYEEVVTCFRDGTVTLRNNRWVRGYTESLSQFGYQGIRRGDLVIHSMDAFAGAVGVSDSNGKGTSVYSVCTPLRTDVNSFYYAYCIREMARNQWILALTKGIRERSTDFRFSTFADQLVPVVPIAEQTTAVRFLEHAQQRIKRYIQTKQKLLKHLEEQKQAFIHQAVTGQINVRTEKPYPAYKPSGVKWLGNVPEHWEVQRLRNLADMRVSNVDKHVKDGENPVRLCNYVDVYNNDYIDRRMEFMPATATNEEIERFRLQRDDVLITKDSETWDDIGVPALVTEPAFDLISGYHLALLRPRPEKLAGAYLLRALQSKGLAYQFHVEAKGVTRYGLSHTGITSVWLPVPPLSEQNAIVHYLDKISANIETAITRIRSQIELFQEYRNCLIADVVTGKLDVSEAAANLPNEAEFLGAMDDSSETKSTSDSLSQVAG